MTNVGAYRDKSPDELADELVKLKKERFNLRFQRASGQLEKTNRVREVRRDIARVLTVISQKARGEAAPARKAKPEKKSPTKAAAKKSRAKAKK